jgi:hypothetical protein
MKFPVHNYTLRAQDLYGTLFQPLTHEVSDKKHLKPNQGI